MVARLRKTMKMPEPAGAVAAAFPVVEVEDVGAVEEDLG
jgi:hypothetical protein